MFILNILLKAKVGISIKQSDIEHLEKLLLLENKFSTHPLAISALELFVKNYLKVDQPGYLCFELARTC